MQEERQLSLQQELLQYWNRLGNKGLFFGLLAAWLLLFQFLGNCTFGYVDTPSLMSWMINAYTVKDSDDAHGLLIPFAVLVLFWLKRKTLFELPQRPWGAALGLLACAVLLHAFGYIVQQPRISIVAFFTGIYALIGLAWGWRWMKASFFPFVLFAFCIPMSTVEQMKYITQPLRLLSAGTAAALANGLFGVGVIRQGTLLFDSTGTYSYDVDAGCSGIRSLITLFLLTVVYGVLTFESPRKRFAIVLLSAPLAVLGNVLRLMSVIISAEMFGQSVGNTVHEWSGFFTYALALGALLAIGRFWREPQSEPLSLQPKTT